MDIFSLLTNGKQYPFGSEFFSKYSIYQSESFYLFLNRFKYCSIDNDLEFILAQAKNLV